MKNAKFKCNQGQKLQTEFYFLQILLRYSEYKFF